MTDKEIKKIAVGYSKSRPADEMPTNPYIAQLIVADALQWLSKDYCIVEKEMIKAEYEFNKHKSARFSLNNAVQCQRIAEWHQGKCDELISLFGTALFNEGKE